jgi:hypothetical protein
MIETAVGTCKYCGQTCTVEVEEGCSQEQVDEVVASECLCEGAKEMRKLKVREERALKNIDALFGDTDTGMILKAAVRAVATEQIDGIKIDIGSGEKAEMKLNKGKIQVQKKTTIVDSLGM